MEIDIDILASLVGLVGLAAGVVIGLGFGYSLGQVDAINELDKTFEGENE